MSKPLSPEEYWKKVEATGMAHEWQPQTLVMGSYRDGLAAAVLGIPTDVNTVRWAMRCQELEEDNLRLHRSLAAFTSNA